MVVPVFTGVALALHILINDVVIYTFSIQTTVGLLSVVAALILLCHVHLWSFCKKLPTHILLFSVSYALLGFPALLWV